MNDGPSSIFQILLHYVLFHYALHVPAGGGEAPSVNTSESFLQGLGLGVGCGLVFCVAFGFGSSAFAAVSFALVVVSRSASVLVVLRGRWFRLPTLLVRFWCWFWSFRGAVVSFVLIIGGLFLS